MASILSDQGILILGEQSGGGSCSVQYCGTADGSRDYSEFYDLDRIRDCINGTLYP